MKKPAPASHLSPLEARAEHARLAEEIAAHDVAYHQKDAPVVSDAEYDALRRRYEEIEAAFPELAESAASLSRKVGAAPAEKFGKVRHAVPMLSLSNIFDPEEAGEFVERVRRFLGLGADEPLAFTAEPKIDGLSCSCATWTANSCRRRRAATATRARTSPPTCAPSRKSRTG